MSSDISVEFAKKIRRLRIEHGYSQEELAFLCGLDRTYIGRLENLKRNPTLPVINKIAGAFDMEVWEILKP
jgi:transcriptional regulator with XRE-family HTH domain